MQIGTAYAAGADAQSDLALAGPRIGAINQNKRLARPFQHHGLHAMNSIARQDCAKGVQESRRCCRTTAGVSLSRD
jgi:hypothetical protein